MSAPPGTQRGPAPATGADPNRCDAATKQNVSLDGTAALRLIQRHTPTTGWHVIGKATVVTAAYVEVPSRAERRLREAAVGVHREGAVGHHVPIEQRGDCPAVCPLLLHADGWSF